MRRWQGVLLGLLTALLAGCTGGETTHVTSWWGGGQPLQVPSGPDIVQMHVALIERPVGDAYLNDRLWTLADEGAVPTDRKGVLEDNGIRIGQVGGLPPPELLTLLTSARSCANPRLIQLHTGNGKDLLLGPAQPVCRFQLGQDGATEEVALEQAQVMLTVVPALAPEGRIRLRFTPQVEHGERKLVPCPAEDHSGMVLLPKRAVNRYAGLGWDVTLAPNEYVVVGARADRPGSLGYQAFVRADESPPVQRLLVIRTSRTAPDAPDDAGDGLNEETLRRAPPVAYQASVR
jgi:hypothetical protein